MDIIVSSLGILYVGNVATINARHKDPMTILKSGYMVTASCATLGFLIICWTLLSPPTAPDAWKHYFACGLCGMLTSYVIVLSTQYFTDYAYYPVRSIAEVRASRTHGRLFVFVLSIIIRRHSRPPTHMHKQPPQPTHAGQHDGPRDQHHPGRERGDEVHRRPLPRRLRRRHRRLPPGPDVGGRGGPQRGALRHGGRDHGDALHGGLCPDVQQLWPHGG